MSSAAPRGPARYLTRGVDQTRLLNRMAAGHARAKHGAELGGPAPASYRTLVRDHLEHADIGFAITDGVGRSRYLIADLGTNQAAWITPHKEHRSTFFRPADGVGTYIGARLAAARQERWRSLDLAQLRTMPTRVESAHRGASRRRDQGRDR